MYRRHQHYQITGADAAGGVSLPIWAVVGLAIAHLRVRAQKRALAIIFVFAIPGVMSAQVTLTPTNQDAVIISRNTNVLNPSNAVFVVSGLGLGMEETNVDRYLNAHGMTMIVRFIFYRW